MNKSDLDRNAYMLKGGLARRGYMRWWHSFVGVQPQTGEERTFFVEYLIMNPGLGGEQPILGQHPFFRKRGMKPSYVMIKAGVFPAGQADASSPSNAEAFFSPECRQLHAFYPISSLKTAKNPLVMQIEDCFYSENRISGFVEVSAEEARHRSFMTDAGYMEWDLEVHKSVACHIGFVANPFFSAIHALHSFWHAEGIRTFYRGYVHLDGVEYRVTPESCYGYADKHWGRSYNRPWLQLASCKLTSERTGKELKHSALAVDGCSSKFLFFPARQRLTIQLTYMGEDFDFHFARPGSFTRSRWGMKTTNKRYICHILAQNKDTIIRISSSCRREELLALQYEAPDGTKEKRPLYGGGLGYGTIQIFRRKDGGKELIDTLTFQNGLFTYRT